MVEALQRVALRLQGPAGGGVGHLVGTKDLGHYHGQEPLVPGQVGLVLVAAAQEAQRVQMGADGLALIEVPAGPQARIAALGHRTLSSICAHRFGKHRHVAPASLPTAETLSLSFETGVRAR
jgi:hypothetical protein